VRLSGKPLKSALTSGCIQSVASQSVNHPSRVCKCQRTLVVIRRPPWVGKSLANRLREAGGTLVVVYPGDVFQYVSPGECVLNPASLEDFHQLLAHISEHQQLPFRGVIHMWDWIPPDSIPITISMRPGFYKWQRFTPYSKPGFYEGKDNNPMEVERIWLLPVGSTGGSKPYRSRPGLLVGSWNTIASEFPELHCAGWIWILTIIPLSPGLVPEVFTQATKIKLPGAVRNVLSPVLCIWVVRKECRSARRPTFRLEIAERGILIT